MKKFLTYAAVPLSVFGVVYAFKPDLGFATIFSLIALVAVLIAAWIEKTIKSSGKEWANRLSYSFTKKHKEYNIDTKRFIYEYKGNKEYVFTKEYIIVPNCSDLDRMSDRFAWSAPSGEAKINSIVSKHEINRTWKKEFWTYFSVYFNETCHKGQHYDVKIKIDNLIDKENNAVPFVSAQIDRKTKLLNLIVKIPKEFEPRDAQLKVFNGSHRCYDEEIHSENLEYDETIKGFQCKIKYPRIGRKYVISWNFTKDT